MAHGWFTATRDRQVIHASLAQDMPSPRHNVITVVNEQAELQRLLVELSCLNGTVFKPKKDR